MATETKKPRGRARKNPAESNPRGRPRKNPAAVAAASKRTNKLSGMAAGLTKIAPEMPSDESSATARGAGRAARFGWLKRFFRRGGKEQPPAPDSNQVLQQLALATHKEQVRARRWRVFFRLAYLALIVWVVSSIITSSRTEIPELGFGPPDAYEQSDKSEPHVAVIPIKGVVLGDVRVPRSAEVVQHRPVADLLRRAFDNEQARAIFLRVDSPGGNPVASSYIYNEIRKLRQENPNKKVYAMVDYLGASAAYHISSAADEIYAHPMSLVGSIGVIAGGFGFDQLLDDYGIERRVYHAGENKAFLDPFLPRNEEHEAHLLNVLDTIHELFIEDVLAGRGERLVEDIDVFSGLVFIAPEALELGLIDGVGFFEEIVMETTGLDNIVIYSAPQNFLDQLSGGIGVNFADGLWRGLSQAFQREQHPLR